MCFFHVKSFNFFSLLGSNLQLVVADCLWVCLQIWIGSYVQAQLTPVYIHARHIYVYIIYTYYILNTLKCTVYIYIYILYCIHIYCIFVTPYWESPTMTAVDESSRYLDSYYIGYFRITILSLGDWIPRVTYWTPYFSRYCPDVKVFSWSGRSVKKLMKITFSIPKNICTDENSSELKFQTHPLSCFKQASKESTTQHGPKKWAQHFVCSQSFVVHEIN